MDIELLNEDNFFFRKIYNIFYLNFDFKNWKYIRLFFILPVFIQFIICLSNLHLNNISWQSSFIFFTWISIICYLFIPYCFEGMNIISDKVDTFRYKKIYSYVLLILSISGGIINSIIFLYGFAKSMFFYELNIIWIGKTLRDSNAYQPFFLYTLIFQSFSRFSIFPTYIISCLIFIKKLKDAEKCINESENIDIIRTIKEINDIMNLLKKYFKNWVSLSLILNIFQLVALLVITQNFIFRRCVNKEFQNETVFSWITFNIINLFLLIIPCIIVNENYKNIYYAFLQRYTEYYCIKNELELKEFNKKELNNKEILMIITLNEEKYLFGVYIYVLNWKIFFSSISIIITLFGLTAEFSNCI